MLLNLINVSKNFGGISAITDLNLKINKGEFIGLIGPNGAGKTTVFNMITGVFHPDRGNVLYNGIDITKYKPNQVAREGIRRTFQLENIFYNLSVLQNMLISGLSYYKYGSGFLDAILIKNNINDTELYDKSIKILDSIGLGGSMDEMASNLPYGKQRRLSIAMAWIGEPDLILLDEPISGMSADEIHKTMNIINSLHKNNNKTIFLIEHNMRVVMKYCERVIVLNFGKLIADGVPKDILKNKEVVNAYLGKEEYVA